MAEGKLDRTLNLSSDESHRSKGSLSVGLDDEKASLGFVDEFKDQQSSENIPLSPQWLYAKPTEIKDGRPQNLPEVPQENKRERRRSTLESENSLSTRRWREEERETGLLGRRGDRPKKESDPPARNPNPSNSTKWSSRWGPDDHRERERETQTRLDKKLVDVPEKEQHETNPNPSLNPSTEKFTPRSLSEIDSRDKWRPRHRQEGPVATHRVAPGFGSERGGGTRQEPIANTGFAAGRGRSSSNLGHAGPIGADPFGRGGGDKVGKISFRYPRGRLLDIYRKNRLVRGNYEDVHLGFEAVPCVTLPSDVSPLAFLAPDDEEKVTLEEIYKGKLTSSRIDMNKADPLKKNDSSRTEPTILALGEEKYTLPTSLGISVPELGANQHASNIGFVEDSFPEYTENPKMSKAEAQDVGFFESSVNLPDDSSSLFDTPFIHDKPAYLGKSPSPPLEEVSLYYQDPQGGIQGPFLGIDIVSWFQEGYFGLDLPVCPTDAPEGTPYRPLGEVMPQLTQNLQSVEVPEPVSVVSNSETEVAKPPVGSLQHNNKNKNELANDGSEVPLEGGNVGWVPQPNQIDSVTASRFDELWPQGASAGMDNEEVIYVGRPNSRMGTQTSDDTDLPLWATSNEPPYNAMSEMGDSSQTASQHNLQVPRSATPSNDNINPLGLLWSELESSQSKQPLSSNLPPNYLKPDPLMDSNLQPRMHHNELELSHFTLEEQLLSEQLHRQQLQQLQQDQFFARAHGGRSQASELDQLYKLQYELEQQRKLQLQQERLQQERLQQERLQQERLQHERLQERLQQERLLQERARREQMMIRQQQIQEQLLLEQMLQQQLQQERQQEQQMLREQQFLNELQRAQHIQRQQQDAAIEQLIQAKFGPASQRQMVSPSIEQQLLLGLQQRDPVQAQHLALALRQQQEQQRLEEEIMLRGARPTGPSAHHAPSLNRTSSSRLSQLERSLSLHDQLQSMERSMSMNAGHNAPSPRNVEFAQTLAQLELQERQLRERQLQERQQRSMFGSQGGPLDQFWPDPNSNPGAAQMERSFIESHLSHQLQLEAESKMRIHKQGSGLEDAHLWGPQEGLNDVMYHQNMPLQSPHGSFKDSSLIFNPNPSPNTNSVISMEAMQSGIRPGSSSGPGSFGDKDLFGNRVKFQNEEIGNPNPNSVPSSDPQFFDSFGEAVIKTDQEPVRAPTPARHASFGSSDDAIFSMGEDITVFSEEIVDSRPRVMSRTDSRTGGSVKNSEADNQHQAAPRPPSRPTSADASRQEARGGLHRSETQGSSKKEIRLLRPPSSSSGELDTSGPTFIEMLKSTKKPPQPASQLDDEVGPGGKGAKKKGKKGRQIDPSLLGFKVHSNRIMMGEIHRPDE